MRQIRTLVRKEVLDILRDKKTLVMMIVVPVLLYPLIIIGMSLLFTMILRSEEDVVHTVGYSAEYQDVAGALQELYEQNEEELDGLLSFVPEKAGEESVKEGADAWLEISQNKRGVRHVTVLYTSSDQASYSAGQTMEELLGMYRDQLLEENLHAEGLSEDFLHPVEWELEDQAAVSESFGMDIGGSIGMILIVTILLGAVYPAIDATAGEKERGTLETLLTLPVTNFQMILSKFISVSLFACVTAVLSLLSLGGSVLFLMFGLSPELAEELQGFSFSAVLRALPLFVAALLVTALLVTALCMCFCLFARSFKEANNYVTPVLLVVMFASMSAMLPSVELDGRTALIPVVNISLMVKQILAQKPETGLILVSIVVNLFYSIALIWILARLYNSEDVLFSDGFHGLRLFQRRSEIRRGTVPGIGDLIISITALLLLLLYVGSAVSVRDAFAGTIVNQLLILAVPLLVVWYMRSDVRTLYSLQRPSVLTCAGGLILYAGTYLLGLASGMALMRLLPESLQNLENAFAPITVQSLPLLILVIAVLPAVGEELLFRGFLFGSLREHFSGRKGKPERCVWAALISGLVFAAFHMSLLKLLPTFLLGAGFAVIVWKGGSICVTMALHFLNNMISVVGMKDPEALGRVLPFLAKESYSAAEMAGMTAGGALLIAAGYALLRRESAKRSQGSPEKV